MFAKLEGDQALLYQNGLFKPTDLYEFSGGLFAKISGGYARLKANGSTSKDGVMVKHLQTDRDLFIDRFERLAVKKGKGCKPFSIDDSDILRLN